MYHELLTDMYEFSMANGYFRTLPHNKQARFDVFQEGHTTSMTRGMIPLESSSSTLSVMLASLPIIVYVFPLPVCP